MLCTFSFSLILSLPWQNTWKTLVELMWYHLLTLNADLSASTQQTNELPCNGSASLEHTLLQTLLSLLCIQCFGWPWQWRCAILAFYGCSHLIFIFGNCYFNLKQERDVFSHMMLLVPMRGLDIVLRVLDPHLLCHFLITNWSLLAHSCYLPRWHSGIGALLEIFDSSSFIDWHLH